MSSAAPRILIVEDNPIVAADLAMTVEGLGGVVVGEAADAAGALALAKGSRADGAFVDLRLRDGCSGFEIARILSERHGLPVVFMTGHASEVPSGFAHALLVIEKPFAAADVKMALALVTRARASTHA